MVPSPYAKHPHQHQPQHTLIMSHGPSPLTNTPASLPVLPHGLLPTNDDAAQTPLLPVPVTELASARKSLIERAFSKRDKNNTDRASSLHLLRTPRAGPAPGAPAAAAAARDNDPNGSVRTPKTPLRVPSISAFGSYVTDSPSLRGLRGASRGHASSSGGTAPSPVVSSTQSPQIQLLQQKQHSYNKREHQHTDQQQLQQQHPEHNGTTYTTHSARSTAPTSAASSLVISPHLSSSPMSPRTPRASVATSPVDVFDFVEIEEQRNVHLRYGALPQLFDGIVLYASRARHNPLRSRKRLFMQLRNRQLLMWKSEDESMHAADDHTITPYRVVPIRNATVSFGKRDEEFEVTIQTSLSGAPEAQPPAPPLPATNATAAVTTKVLSFKTADGIDPEHWVDKIRKAASAKFDEKYNTGKRLGRGAFGEVRVATDRLSGETFAVKTLLKKVASKRQRVLLSREVRALCSVDHDNVVRTVDVFDESGRLCIVSEFVDGGELCKLFDGIEDGMAFPEDLARNISRQIVCGVLHLHQNKIVHRDLKPENILCVGGVFPPQIKLTDFGLANFLEGPDTGFEGANSSVLSSVVGSPVFVAPEMVTRKGYDYQVDMWSVGVLIYQMVSGSSPFGISNFKEYSLFLQNGAQFKEPQWDNVSPACVSFVRSLLQVNPKKRLSSMTALHHEWISAANIHVKYDEKNFASRRLMERSTRISFRDGENKDAIALPSLGSKGKVSSIRAKTVLRGVLSVVVAINRMRRMVRDGTGDPFALREQHMTEMVHLRKWIDRLEAKVQSRNQARLQGK